MSLSSQSQNSQRPTRLDSKNVPKELRGLSGQLLKGLPAGPFINSVSPAEFHADWFWFPDSIPAGQSVCVASSRVPRKLDAYDSWFDAIRTMAVRLDPKKTFFLTAPGTTTDSFVRRLGQLFGFPIVELLPFPDNVTSQWIENCCRHSGDKPADKSADPMDSPSKDPAPVRQCYFRRAAVRETDSSTNNDSIDSLLISIARETRLLSVRSSGNIHQAVARRLSSDPTSSTKLLVDSRLTNNRVKDELIQRGATAWWLYHDPDEKPSLGGEIPTHQPDGKRPVERPTAAPLAAPRVVTRAVTRAAPRAVPRAAPFEAPILELSEIQPQRFVLHWTRRRVGPWPDQTEHEYLDDLIFRSPRRHHGEVSALARILASRRILATNQLTRDHSPVVCFSNLPLTEVTDRTVFRRHLGRWDFLPFGIAIDRERIQELSARPVIYGDEPDWEKLTAEERPFFQLSVSKNSQIDWREEQEWRLMGDLDLNQIDTNSAVAFVRTAAEAEIISTLSRWPIVILE